MGEREEAMLGLRFVLLLAVGLSLGVVYPSADSWAQTTKQAATTKKMKAAVRASQCIYKCPKGLHVCIEDPAEDNGCFPYRCTKGLPGSESCP